MLTRLLSIVLGTAIIFGGVLLAGPASVDASSGRPKAVICHHSVKDQNDNDAGDDAVTVRTVAVADKAVPGHLKHGDTIGPCPVPSPSPSAQVIKIDSDAVILDWARSVAYTTVEGARPGEVRTSAEGI